MYFVDDDAVAIFNAMKRNNLREREEAEMKKYKDTFSYWLHWFLGVKFTFIDGNNINFI